MNRRLFFQKLLGVTAGVVVTKEVTENSYKDLASCDEKFIQRFGHKHNRWHLTPNCGTVHYAINRDSIFVFVNNKRIEISGPLFFKLRNKGLVIDYNTAV